MGIRSNPPWKSRPDNRYWKRDAARRERRALKRKAMAMDEKTVYDPLVAMDKASGDGAAVGAAGGAGVVIGGVLVASLRAHGLAAWPLGLDGAVVGLVATGLAAGVATVKRFLRNRKKHKFGLVVLAMLCLGGGLSGCKTTTGLDGSVVRELDVRGIEETWRRLELKWKEPPPEEASPESVVWSPEVVLPPGEVRIAPDGTVVVTSE